MMASGKTRRYRHNLKVETILCQAPNVFVNDGEGATNIQKWASNNGSLRFILLPPAMVL